MAKATIDDYEFMKRLGQGAFAEVFLMRDKTDKRLYAIKKVSKSLLKREGKIEQAIRERELLSSLNHQGIVRLYKAFHDPSYLYLVMEYCSKESLATLLQRHGKTFPYSLVRHYAAELVQILEILRRSNIIHRDIKPENILISAGNHLKLVDFNCAKKLSSRKTIRNTFVGTLSYVAPEILKNSGHIGPEVDLWSLGCIIYQMLSGKLPFHSASQEQIYENILEGSYILSADLNPVAASLLQSLLVADPEGRLGSNSIGDLKSHSFFEGIDFDTLWDNDVPDAITEMMHEVSLKNENVKEEDKNRGEDESRGREHSENSDISEVKREEEEFKILMDGNVHMKKNMFWTQTRRLVITTEPSIKYYSIKTKQERGAVEISTIRNIKFVRGTGFSIECTKRTYDFTTDQPELWVRHIRELLNI